MSPERGTTPITSLDSLFEAANRAVMIADIVAWQEGMTGSD